IKSLSTIIQFILFIFFQAEDGIRSRNVTGVQTCALPISSPMPGYAPFPMGMSAIGLGLVFFGWGVLVAIFSVALAPRMQHRFGKIGRASCRGRMYIYFVAIDCIGKISSCGISITVCLGYT